MIISNNSQAFYRAELSTLSKGGVVYRKERDSRERDEALQIGRENQRDSNIKTD